jgi:hypothetical protein
VTHMQSVNMDLEGYDRDKFALTEGSAIYLEPLFLTRSSMAGALARALYQACRGSI